MLEPLVITAPTTEPITFLEFKTQARIDTLDSAETNLIEDVYIPSARRQIETLTGRTIHQATLEWVLPAFDYSCRHIVLPRATPLISITSVTLKDSDESTSTWSSANYLADIDSTPGRIALRYGMQWSNFVPSPTGAVRIRYVAGIATTTPTITEADAMVKELACLLVAGMYENRQAQYPQERGIAMLENMRVNQLVAALKVEYGF